LIVFHIKVGDYAIERCLEYGIAQRLALNQQRRIGDLHGGLELVIVELGDEVLLDQLLGPLKVCGVPGEHRSLNHGPCDVER